MPYTPPSQRSPAASSANSPVLSRRSSYQAGVLSDGRPSIPSRPELPRSASYLTRHRRTPSVKTTTYVAAPTSEPTPPGTAESENNEVSIMNSGSLRQSPPPVTDDKAIPNGVVLSPPESPQQNSSDDEEEKSRGRDAKTLAELQASLQVIGQHRQSSPNRQAEDVAKANQALTLIKPSLALDIKPLTENVERTLSQGARKISHSRSNTDSSIYISFDRRSDTPVSGSEEDEGSDIDDDDDRSRRKPPMLRKKSGELVRPALRPSSSRRRPSSMPGTPTFSKAVHFDSHLEHVRHFLQVDRPLAVSASSSPVDNYESDTEFPLYEYQNKRAPPFEWEISVSNFPELTPDRLRSPVRVERVYLSTDNKTLIGSVAVANISFAKTVVSRFTLDYWKTTSEVLAEYTNDVRREKQNDGYDRFNFSIKLADQANLEAKTMFFCVKYAVNGTVYWDNNNNTNFQVDFKKKPKPQNGKNGMQPAGSRPANGLPRSHKKSIARPPMIAATFDDFADGFDSKYDFGTFAKKPVHDFLGESGPVRLKGVKSAITLSSDKIGRRSPNPISQAFANRYDFGASLSAAMSAGNTVIGDKSGITVKPSAKKAAQQSAPPTSITRDVPRIPAPSLAVVGSASGTDSPRPAGTAKPVLASDSYNELLDKYCFFGSVKSSPQLKDGTLGKHPGQFDGNDDNGYIQSQSPSPISNATVSPEEPALEMKTSQPRAKSDQPMSPAPMTGFVTGTSSMYPYRQLSGGFPFNEAHTPTAIRG